MTLINYKSEEEMYPDIKNWLYNALKSYYRKSSLICSYISSRVSVARLLERERLTKYFSNEYLTYDIKVDLLGVLVIDGKGELVFVECKFDKISLRDFSQLLGYSVIARPLHSLIISPKGVSDSLKTLISSFGRDDILSYAEGRKIALTRWDERKRDIDYMNILPKGWSFR